jgi:hypothetical protein
VKIVTQFVKQSYQKIIVILQQEINHRTKTTELRMQNGMEYTKLSNGVEMPTLGYGVFMVSPQ